MWLTSSGHREYTIPIEIPAMPLTKKDAKLLEAALIMGTVLRSDILQQLISKEEVTTWLDSLAVAAAAFAMEKAGYPLSKISEELGRAEATIRRHLKGETKAGQLVKETYELLVKKQLKISIPLFPSEESEENLQKVIRELEEVKKQLQELEKEKERLQSKQSAALELVAKLSETLQALERTLKE